MDCMGLVLQVKLGIQSMFGPFRCTVDALASSSEGSCMVCM